MTLPPIISKTTLQPLFTEKETHAVRVVLHEVNNGGIYRLRCRLRTYLFERDGKVGKHILDIPVSVWMHGTGGSRHEANRSVSEDFRTGKHIPYSIQVISIRESSIAVPESVADQALPLLRKLLSRLGAPDEVVHAFQLIEDGSIDALRSLAEDKPASAPAADPDAAKKAAVAERMRKMREAKAKKKTAKKKALQPA